MSKKNRKIIRRLITVFIAVIIVAGIVLSQSSDRMLKATAVPEEDYPTMAQAGYTEEVLPDEVEDVVAIPQLEKSDEPEEESIEEPVQEEPQEEQMVLGIQKAEPEQPVLEAEPVQDSKEEQPVLEFGSCLL